MTVAAKERRSLRRWLPWLALLTALGLIAVLARPTYRDGPALHPSSTGPIGTKGLVDSLAELGADVRVQAEPPGPRVTTALLLVDGLDDPDRDGLAEWVRDGGILVVADVGSPLHPALPTESPNPFVVDPAPELRRGCELSALSTVERVVVPGAAMLEVPPGATGCFRQRGRDGAWMVVLPLGRGTVVGLGGPGAFVNERLDDADNGVLAATLLVPNRGSRVAVLVSGGRKDLSDLVSPRVKLAMFQLGVAFVTLALWRGRRLGRPVLEPQPVAVAGSELVVAVGELMQRARGRAQASELLRADLRRTFTARLGLPAQTPAAQLADVVAERTGTPVAEVLATLAGDVPADEAGLVELAQSIESLRLEVVHA